jgi:polysaccharide deacetylase family protein (PEP-CTERM system associated)
MTHQLVWQQSRQEFRADVEASVKMLEDITGRKVTAFRAPGFSIHETEAWAFDVLADLGIETDCSIFPASHAHGGMPSYGAPVPSLVKHGDVIMKEFPISTKTMLGRKLIFSGGGYFRLFPYPLIKKWSKESDKYLMSYIHPRDLDGGQPVLEGLPLARRFKSYVGVKGAEKKLRNYLTDFDFMDIQSARKIIDWDKVPVVQL